MATDSLLNSEIFQNLLLLQALAFGRKPSGGRLTTMYMTIYRLSKDTLVMIREMKVCRQQATQQA